MNTVGWTLQLLFYQTLYIANPCQCLNLRRFQGAIGTSTFHVVHPCVPCKLKILRRVCIRRGDATPHVALVFIIPSHHLKSYCIKNAQLQEWLMMFIRWLCSYFDSAIFINRRENVVFVRCWILWLMWLFVLVFSTLDGCVQYYTHPDVHFAITFVR